MQNDYKIKAKEAVVFVPGADSFVLSAYPAYKQGETVKGILDNARMDSGRNISAIKVGENKYLRPQDVQLVDATGDVIIKEFADKAPERTLTRVENFNSPIVMYSSDGLRTYLAERPKPIFKIENNKLVRTGETYTGTDVEAIAKKVKLGDKIHHLLEVSPDKYLIHINVKPVSPVSLFMNASGENTNVSREAKEHLEKGDCLTFCPNTMPMWAKLFPLVGTLVGTAAAASRGKASTPWDVLAWGIAGASIGMGAVLVLKPKPKTI